MVVQACELLGVGGGRNVFAVMQLVVHSSHTSVCVCVSVCVSECVYLIAAECVCVIVPEGGRAWVFGHTSLEEGGT